MLLRHILPSISSRNGENERSVYTHEFSIIGRYFTLFLPYWDYIKAWNWGFFLSCFSVFFSSSEQYKNILWRQKMLRQMRNLNFIFFLSFFRFYRCGKLVSSIYTFTCESILGGWNDAILGIWQLNWIFIMCVHWKYTIIKCEQKSNIFSAFLRWDVVEWFF